MTPEVKSETNGSADASVGQVANAASSTPAQNAGSVQVDNGMAGRGESSDLPSTPEEGQTNGMKEETPVDDPAQVQARLVEELRGQVTEAQAKAAEYLDQMQRTAAEFQNSRRRQERQLTEEIDRANSVLIRQLLPVLDDFELAFRNLPPSLATHSDGQGAGEAPTSTAVATASQTAWVEGFRQIQHKLSEILADQGLKLIETAGEFDPMRHEAIASEQSDTHESGQVIESIRAGYEYKGRVLRPALVRIAL